MSPIRQSRWALILGLLVSLAVVLGCSLPGRILEGMSEAGSSEEAPADGGAQRPATESASGEMPAPAPGLTDQVSRGELEIVRVVANGEIAGLGIQVVVHNPGPEDIETFIPCGLFFEPADDSDQRLMVVQPVSAVVPAGGEVELTAFVVCIDSTSSTPEDGATYALGTMESGDLLKLAECACGEDLGEDSMQGMGIMLAGWSINAEQTVDEMQAEGGEGAMGEVFGEGMSGLLEMFGTFSSDWFDKCDIPQP
jgi:hypothetical protein